MLVSLWCVDRDLNGKTVQRVCMLVDVKDKTHINLITIKYVQEVFKALGGVCVSEL